MCTSILYCVEHARGRESDTHSHTEREREREREGGREREREREERERERLRKGGGGYSTQCRTVVLTHVATSAFHTTKTRAFMCQHWRSI